MTSRVIELDLSIKVIHPHRPHRINTSILPSRQSLSPHRRQAITVRGSHPRHKTAETLCHPRSPRQFRLHNMAGFNRRTMHQRVVSMGTSQVPSLNTVTPVTKPKRPTRLDLSFRPVLVYWNSFVKGSLPHYPTRFVTDARRRRRPGGGDFLFTR